MGIRVESAPLDITCRSHCRARHGLEDYVDDGLWRGDQWRMVNLLRSDPCVHALRQKELRGRVDHPVFFGNEIPRRLCPPSGPRRLLLNARNSDWSLCCCEKCSPFEGSMLRESSTESLV